MAMKIKKGHTYWGTKVEEGKAVQMGEEERRILGLDDRGPKDQYAKHLWDNLQEDGQNARQIMARLKAEQGTRQSPEMPGKINQKAPDSINIYTDGAIKCPTNPYSAIGGFGIWIPSAGEQQQEVPHHKEEIRQYVKEEVWNGGTAMWAPLKGAWQSSTRAELAALVLALHIKEAMHFGIDNKAVVDKSNQLIARAKQLQMQPTNRMPFRMHSGGSKTMAIFGSTSGSSSWRDAPTV